MALQFQYVNGALRGAPFLKMGHEKFKTAIGN